MTALTVALDERTAAALQALSEGCHVSPSEFAARLLRRAVRAGRPSPTYDLDAIRENCREFAAEDSAIAESDAAYRADLLVAEDSA
ncbi:MAG: hypothetical protein NT029_16815 [Armatimonadetes bacterium]|nr:hypothetical protein [Armatimonadota bacterium]